jgi:hypothetical protein
VTPQAQAQKPIHVTPNPKRALGKEFTYDISHLQKTDPQQLLYGAAARWPTQLKELRAVATTTDQEFWAGGDAQVIRLNRNGDRLRAISLPGQVRCLAVAPDRTLYVGLPDRVCVLNADGAVQRTWSGFGAKAVLTSLAANEQAVFVADAGNRVVHRLDRSSGQVVKRIGKKDLERGIPGLVAPSPFLDVALGPEGLLWVANPGRHCLEAYTLEGDLELSWGEFSNGIQGFCGCCNPVHFALLPDGRVVTSEKGLTRVKIYTARGEFVGVVAGPEEFPQYRENPQAKPLGLDIAADAEGRVLVADTLGGHVREYQPKQPSTGGS